MQSQLILFVGLQTANERMLRSAVCAEGHHVISVDSVVPQTSIERERPDLVVLNLTSFNSTEWETLRRIRDESRVPIIALTARVDPAHLLAAYQYGVDD